LDGEKLKAGLFGSAKWFWPSTFAEFAEFPEAGKGPNSKA
jgi:hypothetical protein